jgi:glycosyltransferase 2 family protein
VRDRVFSALRGLLTLVFAALVVWRIDLDGVRQVLFSLTPSVAVLALGFTLLTPVVGAYRFRRTLAWVGQRPPLSALLADLLVASAYNLVLPSSMGGDLVRAARAGARVSRPSLGYACIVYERTLGLFVLSAAASLGALALAPLAGMTLVVFSALAVACTALVLWRMSWFLKALAAGFAKLPRLAAALNESARAAGGPLSRPRAAIDVGSWSLLYQLSNLSILAVVAAAWGEPRWALSVYLGVPVALLVSALPITIGGFGLRESLFVTVLGAYGLSSERALVLSLLWVASSGLLALLGIAVLLRERFVAPGSESPARKVNAERAVVFDD